MGTSTKQTIKPAESNDSITEEQSKESNSGDAPESTYTTGWKLAMIVISLQLTNFCVAIDSTIIATAIPRITDDFASLGNVGWYG